MENDENRGAKRLTDLRQRAEYVLRHELEDGRLLRTQDVEDLLHELHVYQIELEIQNEELRQAQVKLAESRDQYSELYDFAPLGYMTIGLTGRIEQANLTSATLLGVPRQQLMNRPFTQFVFRADQDLLYHHRRQVFAEPKNLHRVELRLLRAKNTPFYAQLESQAANILQGKTTGYRMIVSDITLRKQNEADLQASNQQLNRTIEGLRTAQEKLVQQERLAVVGQLAAGVAHDFNNILAIISNYTALLLHQTTFEADIHRKVTTIKEQVEAATKLVQQMLDFSRKSTCTRQEINITQFLVDSVELLSTPLPTNIQLDLQTPQEIYLANVDSVQLQQVLINLVNNACAVMADGGKIKIELSAVDIPAQGSVSSLALAPGAWLQIKVIDPGSGIPPEVLSHLFEPFFTTKGHLGHGLGLAQAYGIIKQHEGEIEVVTEVGKGTSFILYLPRVISAQPISQLELEQTQQQTANADLPPQGNGETILIVEDNEILRQTMADLLELIGYHVLSAASGADALKLYLQARNRIELVLTDLTMPNMNGIELSKALRQLNPSVKMIIATGYQPDAVDSQQLSEGETIWLQKPIPINLLSRTVAQMISKIK